MKRAHPLPQSTQRSIWKYKCKYPSATFVMLAERYNCTYDQARNACLQGGRGTLGKNPTRNQRSKAGDLQKSATPDDLMAAQFHQCAAELSANTTMTLQERVTLLEKLAFMRKTLLQLTLVAHMRRTDAGIILMLIRRWMPECTSEESITIYLEAKRQWELEQ